MQAHQIPVFKSWVSEWMARAVIFAILMTCLFSFAFYGSPVAAMGFYGIQPTDVQYAMVVIYGSTVAFLALDFRMVKYFAPRKYLVMALAINALCAITCFYSRDWVLFVICQFVQGITCALMSGIVLQLIFPRLHSTRARVIAYTVLYGSIQISVPFYSICASVVLYFYDFSWLFYGLIITLVLLTLMVLITMNGKARFTKKIPLYQVDWVGYLLYVLFVLIFGYILVYGRQLGWFGSPLIRLLCLSEVFMLVIFIIRELRLKRPLINLRIFKTSNFIIGLLLLFAFYIFKGSTGLTYTYLEVILGNDPLSTIPIWTTVIVGTVLSMFVTSRFILMGINLVRIIVAGFCLMAIYYGYMLLFVAVQGETIDFILPMFIYGVATGVLFVPIVIYTVSAVPAKIAFNASLVGILARFMGFTGSLAVNNELQLFTRAVIREKVREGLTETNPRLSVVLFDIQHSFMMAGSDVYTARGVSGGYFNQLVGRQILARGIRDYYDWMLVGVVGVIVVLLLVPGGRRVVVRLRRGSVGY